MPDLSKCSGAGCPIKDSCWRFKVPADGHLNPHQSWITPPFANGRCDSYWQMPYGESWDANGSPI